MLIFILLILKYLFLIALVALLGYLAFIMVSFRNKVPFVPTPKKIIRLMVDLAEIQKAERVCDLGSGTGRIIMAAAKHHKSNLIIGIEKSLVLRLVNKFLLIFHPFLRRRIQIVNQDFFNLDLRQFDVIFCFLTPEAMRLLAPKFQLLKIGSRIISYMFPLEKTQNFEERIEYATTKDSVYIYKKIN